MKRISSWLSEPAPAEDAPDSQAEIIELAQRMREKMQSTGILPLELSKILGVDVVSIKAWEGGWGLPDANVIGRISEWLSDETHDQTAGEDISSVILWMRLKRGISQEELAGLLFVSQSAVEEWESGKVVPNDFDMVRIDAWFTGELMARGASRDENIGVKMNETRHQRGMSQAELGRLLDVSPTTIGNWEAGKCLPNMLKAARITAWLSEDV